MKDKITAVLTGDIVGSRKSNANHWLKELKAVLKEKSKSTQDWEIFRGDKFQINVDFPKALETALIIKAKIKQIKKLDVRIAIGIGKQEFKTIKITESNGEAYSNSGICFENLKKRRLAIKTPWEDFDEEWNLYFKLASLTIDAWTPITSEIVATALRNKNLNQKEIALKLKRSQSTISESLNRAGYEEVSILLFKFEKELNQKTQQA